MEGKNREAGPLQSKWTDDLAEDNDILKRAKNMSAMAFLMYQFTKGSGSLRTTQDLFTQAEYFAEEANRLYKVLRHFSYQVVNDVTIKSYFELTKNTLYFCRYQLVITRRIC